MEYIFQQGAQDAPVLLLLHGTGGNERDLLPLAEMIDSGASVLSVRGNISENGMPRFFKRLREGVFDEEDLQFRTKELAEFLDEMAEEHQFDRSNVIAVGYSNGANIAGSLLFHYADVLKGAILLHPMVPMRGLNLPDMKGAPVFIGAGTNDPICSPEETKELNSILNEQGASVTIHWENNGHQLTKPEIDQAKDWYHDQFK
ncbi:carboxylesterase [Pontibacillus yanchengensis]|uniref:Carboxylesterase n=2 Tax=Pontibacillus yanchengensis TaxID=462910 RepID=A0A6I4ZVR1_9BACI|nr:alpha/beta hydrolase [Pontibacillus yanchengensis]MYL32836.1 carboxylesterase [Pontibacillus yanchengensis]MYL51748.1 carboxylesterase [Pontibacillus yanchengensis]